MNCGRNIDFERDHRGGCKSPDRREVRSRIRAGCRRVRGELSQAKGAGAAVCVYQRGRKVVDIWGGHQDPPRERPWNSDTIVSMASVVKGMLAYAVHLLADRGKVDYEAPVADYWPQFAQARKARIGYFGGGGSCVMADRQNGLSVAYALNRYWPAFALGDRARTLIEAAYASL
jgi:CubicO group peptidase (beta-lactamase class C family)